MRAVFDVDRASDAGRSAHCYIYIVEQIRRHDNVSVYEDEHVSICITGAGVPSACNAPLRLVNHLGALFPGDGSSPIIAVVIDNDHVDVDPPPGSKWAAAAWIESRVAGR